MKFKSLTKGLLTLISNHELHTKNSAIHRGRSYSYYDSVLLNTSAIYYAGSDTCGTLEYHLYSNGVSQEKLSFEEGIRKEFQSQIRQVEARNIKSAYAFTMNFIHEQDAYIPCLIEVEGLSPGQRTTLRIEDLMPNEVERMDYSAQQ
ncbi:hypothetical protein [Nostoc sp. MG11]|uniref:hypothetical protein n=1 Tax=Nostoc sp. MG11 TaxID=2721166 RepID=UPI0018678633|nr:hypothetical protein [Nostoc sp. MG11]